MGFTALAHGMIIISYNYAEASKLAPLGYFGNYYKYIYKLYFIFKSTR